MVHSFWKISGRDISQGSTLFPYGMFQTINNHCFSNWKQELDWVILRVFPRGCLHCRLFKQMEQKFSVVPVKAEKKIMGAFLSTKTSGLNFRQFPVANGTAFSKKEDNLAMCTQILEKFFAECFKYRNVVRLVMARTQLSTWWLLLGTRFLIP